MAREVTTTFTYICDVCGSEDDEISFGMPQVGVSGMPVDVCSACVRSATVADVLAVAKRQRAALIDAEQVSSDAA